MIGRLSGKLLEKQAPHLLIDVNGVGYEVDAPMTTIYQLGDVGQPIQLCCHLVVREDAQQLYGFIDQASRDLFRLLLKTSGVGPRLALAILSQYNANDFVQCVMDNNTAALVKIPGVGNKTAQRLLIEMQDRLKDWQQTPSTIMSDGCVETMVNTVSSAVQEAVGALVALGFKAAEANRMIKNVREQATSSEDLIRLALSTQ